MAWKVRNNVIVMAGEMSKDDLNKEEYPLHFAVAEKLGGTVEPFDVYQGPYVSLPGRRLFLMPDPEDESFGLWYDTVRHEMTDSFRLYHADSPAFAEQAADSMVNFGGGIDAEEWQTNRTLDKERERKANQQVWLLAQELWADDHKSPSIWKDYIKENYPELAHQLENSF
jgi:hypothetical protein